MDVVIDDHLLLRVLLGSEPSDLRLPGARIITTGLFYHRLCRAIDNRTVAGALSGMLGRADTIVAAAAVRAITALPEMIEVVSLHDLAWPIARLVDDGVRLNLMSLEALAATEHQRAELCLATADENPPLLAEAARRRTPTRLVGL